MLPAAKTGVARRILRWLAVALLLLGVYCTLSGLYEFYVLTSYAQNPPPPARTAQEDYATNPYWLNFFGKLNLAVGLPLLAAGAGLLALPRRRRRHAPPSG
jgi:hypothetical protein